MLHPSPAPFQHSLCMVPYKRSLTRVRSLSSLLPPPILYHHTRTLPPFPTTLYTTKVFAVLSGTHFNSGCCFDYGNSEVNDKDDGPGTMEAIYFGNAHWRGNTGAGDTGPWVGADLEQGMYVEERRWRSVDLLMPCMCVCVSLLCVTRVCAYVCVCVRARACVLPWRQGINSNTRSMSMSLFFPLQVLWRGQRYKDQP